MSIGIVGLLAQLRLMVVVCRRASGASKLDKTARPWSEVRVEKVSESRSRETQRQRLIPSPVRATASLPRISHVHSETSRADKARVQRGFPVRFSHCRVHVVGLRVARSEGSEAAARGSGESAFLPRNKSDGFGRPQLVQGETRGGDIACQAGGLFKVTNKSKHWFATDKRTDRKGMPVVRPGRIRKPLVRFQQLVQ